jgi:hypothetical protein
MKVLDFQFYYLTVWFEKTRDKLKWSTPIERTCYAMGLGTVSLFFGVYILAQYTIFRSLKIGITWIFLLVIGFGSILAYRYIYIKQERLQTIQPSNFLLLKNMSEQNRMKLAMGIFLLLIISPYIFMFILVPVKNGISGK